MDLDHLADLNLFALLLFFVADLLGLSSEQYEGRERECSD